MHIVGTAGHVDHGKSALVIALTGHNPDRWIEERERGMTLDLGFAPLFFEDGVEAGIIDVPGHERFVHNMLAGAAGMELLLLVIAATEGPRPQTLDHLRILNYLNVTRAIVVLTKSDLVSSEELEIAADLARDACGGTVAEGAPIVAVSNVTGAGVEELKRAIHDSLADLPARNPDAPAYMPVDRVFALPGRGTILTGTLMQGTLRTGDTLALQPSGIAARVRSLQIFGRSVERATGGSRVAVNVPGIETSAISRGETLVAPREFAPSADLAIAFAPLGEALPLFRRRTHVRAHIGSAEIPGLLYFSDGPPRDATPARARLALSRPAVTYPGSRLVLRRLSPKDLLGGGVVVVETRAAAINGESSAPFSNESSLAENVWRVAEGAGLSPLPLTRIASLANVTVELTENAIAELLESGRLIALSRPLEYLSAASADAAFEKVSALLRALAQSAPWHLGMTADEIATVLGIRAALTLRLLNTWQADGRIAQRGRYWNTPDFTPMLSKDQQRFFASVLAQDRQSPLLPLAYDELAQRVKASGVLGAADAFETLLATGALVHIGSDLYQKSQIERARSIMIEVLRRDGGATMARLRDAFGTSRKYALPLMEYFDSQGWTIRDGDIRRLRRRSPQTEEHVQTVDEGRPLQGTTLLRDNER